MCSNNDTAVTGVGKNESGSDGLVTDLGVLFGERNANTDQVVRSLKYLN